MSDERRRDEDEAAGATAAAAAEIEDAAEDDAELGDARDGEAPTAARVASDIRHGVGLTRAYRDARRAAALSRSARSPEEAPSAASRLNAAITAAQTVATPTLLLTVARMNEVDVTGQSTPLQTLGITFDFYLLPALVMFVLVAVFAWFGAFRHWLTGALAGLLSAIGGSILGYALRVALGGTVALDGSVWGIIASQVFGLFFPFLVLGTLLGAVAPFVWRRALLADPAERERAALRATGFRPLPYDGKVALVRIPSDLMAEGERTHADRSPIDAELANEQWEAYVAMLEEHGWETAEVPAAPTMPDSVFVEDQVVVLGDVAVLTRTGAASRRAELPGIRVAVAPSELVEVELEAPATLDGGDVLVVEDTVFVGASSRTNTEGIRQLREIAGELGYRVVAVPIRGALHLKTAATALPDGTVVVWRDAFEGPLPFGRVVEALEPQGASVLPLDAATVAVSAAAPKTAALIRSLGYDVVELDVSEFEKAEGGLTCLSARYTIR